MSLVSDINDQSRNMRPGKKIGINKRKNFRESESAFGLSADLMASCRSSPTNFWTNLHRYPLTGNKVHIPSFAFKDQPPYVAATIHWSAQFAQPPV